MFCLFLCFYLRQHNRQLDPTEIVLVPYDLVRLTLFVCGVGFVYVVSIMPSILHILNLLAMTLCIWIAYIIYGASPTENLWHTLAAALYLMLLIQFNPPLWGKSNEHGQVTLSCSMNTLERLSLASTSTSRTTALADRLAVVQTRCVLGLTTVLHILRLYDRGWQAQRWPVPTILGASLGWMVGQWIGLLLEMFRGARQPPSEGKR